MANTYVTDYTRQTEVIPGNCYCILMPYSEVCDHMRVSGTVQSVLVTDYGVYLDEGKGPFLTYGEAGIYEGWIGTKWFYGMKLASDDKAETL